MLVNTTGIMVLLLSLLLSSLNTFTPEKLINSKSLNKLDWISDATLKKTSLLSLIFNILVDVKSPTISKKLLSRCIVVTFMQNSLLVDHLFITSE